MSQGRFSGSFAIVTGAASGIGCAAARRLCDEGAEVIAVDRSSDALEEAHRDLAGVRTLSLDLAEADAALRIDRLGQADILVNAAGILRRSTFTEHTRDDWEATLDVNVRAVFRLSREFARAHVEDHRPGVIVNVCSVESYVAIPQHAAYTASKAAVLMLTRAFAAELAPHGVRVCGIAPGVTETGMNATLRADPVRSAELARTLPMGRFAGADEQAAAICFLASADASYITGAVLRVDGGYLTL
jgi:NAD(P)-dependent dehydrogenase (short-subunit alcohol dehydrogenase family)